MRSLYRFIVLSLLVSGTASAGGGGGCPWGAASDLAFNVLERAGYKCRVGDPREFKANGKDYYESPMACYTSNDSLYFKTYFLETGEECGEVVYSQVEGARRGCESTQARDLIVGAIRELKLKCETRGQRTVCETGGFYTKYYVLDRRGPKHSCHYQVQALGRNLKYEEVWRLPQARAD